jgi:hypothetical protein
MPLQYDKSQKTVENPATCQGFVCSGQLYSSTSGSDTTKRGLHVDVYCITHYQAALENERRHFHTINTHTVGTHRHTEFLQQVPQAARHTDPCWDRNKTYLYYADYMCVCIRNWTGVYQRYHQQWRTNFCTQPTQCIYVLCTIITNLQQNKRSNTETCQQIADGI